jgi:Skp family chaperone for outer membrane proteins
MADENQNQNDPLSRLVKLIGFHPTKDTPVADPNVGGVFAQALLNVKKKKEAAALDAATKLFEQAFENQSKWEEVERRFNAEKKKHNKEMGKIVTKIEALARGESLASIEAKAAENKDKEDKETAAAE